MCTCVRGVYVCVCTAVYCVCEWVYFAWRGGKWIKKCLRLDRLIRSTLQSGWESLAKRIRNMPPKCLRIDDDAPLLHHLAERVWKCLRRRFYNSTMCPATNWFCVNVCSRPEQANRKLPKEIGKKTLCAINGIWIKKYLRKMWSSLAEMNREFSFH